MSEQSHRIVVSGLRKRFGDVVAVEDLSFSAEPGRVTGFLGPNGAGKSTTLRMLLGLVAPDAGSATIAGRAYASLDEPTRHVGAVLDAFGRIDILVNNAATMQRAPAAKHPDEMWDETIEVNLSSVFLLSRAAGGHMLERGSGGKIINIASMLSFQGGITVPSYAAAKGGVAQLTKAMANEWAPHRINVNAIAPGYMATDNTSALQADPVRSRQIGERIPAGRWGRPEDLGGAVVFLASAASDYVNGHVLVVDGGWLGR